MIGYLEPHDRPETAALAEGLEVVPRLRAQHGARARGDGRRRGHPPRARARAVDELAHTNAPGMRNEKRYQDIDEILDAGIDVISTVNVQHLESLNDAIFELTDVRVRETFPDRILDEADEVVLVDLTPEALQERLRAGQGLPEGARRRRAGQLLPRRQARPRCASSPCARSPRTSRRAGSAAARAAQPAGGRRARARPGRAAAEVAADHAPRLALGAAARRGDGRALGAARRAGRRREEEATQLAALRRLAVILGVHFLEEEGDDLVATVRRVAAERGSTYVFVGTPDESRRREIFGGSLLSRMVRELPGSTSASSPAAPSGTS